MPNKELEPTNKPVGSLLASDPRYFEINLLQEGIIDAAQALLAKESVLTHPSEKIQQFVAGRRTDLPTTPEIELMGYLEGIKARQVALLQMDPNDYRQTPDIQLLRDIVSGLMYVEGSEVEVPTSHSGTDFQPEETMALVKVGEGSSENVEDGAWPLDRSDAEWDELFQQTAFSDEYAWVESLFATELVYREFFRESKV